MKIRLTENKLKEAVSNAVKKALKEYKNLNENYASKKKYINRIYKAIHQLTGGLYSDESWEGVTKVVDTIRTVNGINDVSCWVENGGYRENDGAKWKEYLLEVETETGDIINGTLNCHAAGTMEDPFQRYDITVYFY